MKLLSFPKSSRLKTNRQFKSVFSYKCRCSNELLTLYVGPNDLGISRLGVTVGRAYGPAVVRNRFKRLIRESFRQSQQDIPTGYDYLLTFSAKLSKKTTTEKKNLSYNEIRAAFLDLVARGVRKFEQ